MTVTDYLLAVVLAVSGGHLTIDKGLIDGVRPGDQGRLGYLLTINEREKKLIETVSCQVVKADDQTAVIALFGSANVRPGFVVRLPVPAERTAPASLLAIGRERLEAGQFDLALSYFRRVQESLPHDAVVEELIQETHRRQKEVVRRVTEREQATRQEAERRKSMILVPGGTFEIGVDIPEAKFYNQHPRFKVQLNSFWIDRAATNLLGYSYLEAEKYCRDRGKRLPTELELEAASTQSGFEVSANAEWTASWYLPYPGNKVKEKEYGEKYRVIRGPTDLRLRTFMLPSERAVDTSFRCACDQP